MVAKVLQDTLPLQPRAFANAAVDLVLEAEFLSRLDHAHICKIRGTSALGYRGYASGDFDGFFVLLDRLEETLSERIARWRRQSRQWNRWGKLLLDRHGRKRKRLLVERLQIAADIASAMAYLHENGVILRDLKPNNIGFDADGNVKVFDFGLCRQICRTDEEDEAYYMSPAVGTVRYMAPEVLCEERYNFKADVYSYTTVLYDMLCLERRRQRHKKANNDKDETRSTQEERHHQRRRRHDHSRICPSWPLEIRLLLQRGWSQNHEERPSMKEILCTLQTVLQEMEEEEENEPDLRKSVNRQRSSRNPIAIHDSNHHARSKDDEKGNKSCWSWRTTTLTTTERTLSSELIQP